MSTAQRLDPPIRTARTERATLERFFTARARHTVARIASAAVAASIVLAQLRLDSRRSGKQKHAIVARVQDEYVANVRYALLELGAPSEKLDDLLAEHPDVPHGILTVH